MNNIIEQMLSKYEIKNINDQINALKEIIQEIVLAGLSRGGFFNEDGMERNEKIQTAVYDSRIDYIFNQSFNIKYIGARERFVTG